MTQPASSAASDLPATVDGATASLLALFTLVEQQLLTGLAEAGRATDTAVLLLTMQRLARQAADTLRRAIPPAVEQVIVRTAADAIADADAELRQAGALPPAPPRRRPPRTSGGRPAPHRPNLLRDLPPARRAEADDLTRRLMATISQVVRIADDAYRAAVVRELPALLRGDVTTGQAQAAAWRRLTEQGITGFVDSKGRRWNLASYVEMATRTAVQRTYNAQHLERFIALGVTQVAVPNTGHPCPLCRPWEGKVLTIDPAGPSPTIAEAEAAGLHHPNCRHTWLPYIPGRTRLPRPKAWTDGDARRYRATQHLRSLERAVRAQRRVGLAATDDLERTRAARRVRALQARIRAHVDEHGLVRRPRREKVDLGYRDDPPTTSAGGGGAAPPPPRPPSPPAAGDGGSDDYWRGRQDALGIDTHGERLKPHEIEFVERFQALGHRLDWIPRDPRMRPSNDFRWLTNGGLLCELKSPKARYPTIRRQLLDSVSKAERQGVTKENFVIDLGGQPLTDELRDQLASYNTGRRQYRIARLWVLASGALTEIVQTER